MIEYAIIYRKGSLADHFKDLSYFLLKIFERKKKKDKDIGKYYDIVLIPPKISESIEAAIARGDLAEILLLDDLADEQKEIYRKFMVSPDEAVNIVKEKEDMIGCIHSDIITPYRAFDVGNKIYKGFGVLEIDLFSNFDIIPHFSGEKDLYLIKLLKKRYSNMKH
jgi:hypothetical protein